MTEKYRKMTECRARKKKLTEARRELRAIEKIIEEDDGSDADMLEDLERLRGELHVRHELAEVLYEKARRAAMQEIERETNGRKGKFWIYYACEGMKIERAAEISGISWGTAYKWLRAERRARG